MQYIDKLAEPRIQEAIGRGELDNLPGTGKPLVLDDDTFVPPELRIGYRVLKNAGYVPRDIQLRSEISELEALVTTVDDLPSRARAYQRLNYLRAQLQATRRNRTDLRVEQVYHQRLLDRVRTTRGIAASVASRRVPAPPKSDRLLYSTA